MPMLGVTSRMQAVVLSDEQPMQGQVSLDVIPFERRNDYMAAFEAASVNQDIKPFAGPLSGLLGRTQIRTYAKTYRSLTGA